MFDINKEFDILTLIIKQWLKTAEEEVLYELQRNRKKDMFTF